MVLYFLALGIGSIVITGIFSFFTARSALLERTYDQLTSLRLARQAQIETFFNDRLRETAYFAGAESTVNLTRKMVSSKIPDTSMEPEKYENVILASGYYNGFFIFDKNGRPIYKSPTVSDDFADLQSNEMQLLYEHPQKAFINDYSSTNKANNKLSCISAITINGETAAYLCLIIKPGLIDNFMLEEDPARGLGYTGETYLVGPDYLMRSQSRFIQNSVMQTRVITTPVIKALEGSEGVAQIIDYRNIEVLSSYGKATINGLKWVILAEIDYGEATASIYIIRNNIMLLTVLIGLAFFILTYAISRKFTRPLIKLKDAAIELGEGRLSALVGIESDDEIGELTEAFNSMAINLHEKDKALKLERVNRLKSAIDGQDQERQRLSRELHDGIGQSMIAIRLKLGVLENAVPPKIKENIQSVILMTDNLIDEVRAISNALMPPSLAEFGLSAAIRNLCNSLSETNGIQTDFKGEIPGQVLGRKAKLYLFRIFQEALNNIAKHAEATSLEIEAYLKENLLYIRITDNGKGFDQQSACNEKGHGLNNIIERASLLKGKATILSDPGNGTSIEIEIPVTKNTP
jgi:signal transduction histidine kinase